MDSPLAPRLLVNSSDRPSRTEQSTLLFAGDFYLGPNHPFQDGSDLFASGIIELLRHSAFSMVNFEGTLAAEGSQAIPKEGPHLALDQRAPAVLKSAGFHGIGLANNHAMDYGVESLRHTLQICADCGLRHVGANSVPEIEPLKVCLPGNVKLQVLSFCEREFGVSIGSAAGTAWLTSPQAEDTISQAKKEADVVIVCAHGGNELMPLPSPQRRQQLRNLIDAGADLVIGHHPHVAQGWERYDGRYIFYSLGDFYFDSIDGIRQEYRDWGFMVRVHLEEGRIKTLEIVPYERVEDKIAVLGTRRDSAPRLSYLDQISGILASPQYEGYWQQLAVERLSAYKSFLRGVVPYSRISFRGRVKEALRLGHEMWNLLHLKTAPHNSWNSSSMRRYNRQALGTLNVIRCDSHRWAIETALAVLTGECEDLRSQKIKDELEAIGPLYGEGDY